MRKFYLLLFVIMYAILPLSAQYNRYQQQDNALLRNHLTTVENGWVRFIDDIDVPTFLQELASSKREMGLSNESKLRIRTGLDTAPVEMSNFRMGDLKKNVIRLDQYHNNIKVEGAQMVVNLDERRNVRVIHGNLAEDLDKGGYSVNIDEKTALRIALKAINAKKYAWESPEMEQQIKLDLEDRNATNYPKATLLYARAKAIKDFTNKNMHLVYKFEISAIEPFDHREVLIDTKSGEIIRNMSLMQEGGPSIGTVQTMYNGVQIFTTHRRGFPNWDYVLRDKTRGDIIHTKYWTAVDWIFPDVDDNNNVWDGSDREVATAHWAAQKTWDYYWNTFGLNGMDGDGGKIRILAQWNEENANFKQKYGYDYLTFGRRATGETLATLDIVGHEFTHGVIKHDARLIYQGESGALNESFADIFGVMTERSIEGNTNWTIGEDIGGVIRSLQDPNSLFNPDTFNGNFWINPNCNNPNRDNDYCGVHTNSSVQNHWFFLLSEGGNGVNDNGDTFNVQGIGVAKAARIAYRSMMNYMHASSDFQDARLGALSAAWDLYGDCSAELIAVIDAWHAVGVGTAYNNNTVCFDVSINGPYSLNKGQGSTWSANISEYNGNASYSYQWFRSYDNGSESMVSTAFSYSTYMSSNVTNMKLRLVVTANGYKIEQATKYITCTNCSNDCDNPYAINAYPNPVVSKLTVKLLFPTPCKVAQQQITPYTAMIFDESTGKLVLEETFYGNEYQTERFARLPKGTYALKLIINEKTIVQHLIKE